MWGNQYGVQLIPDFRRDAHAQREVSYVRLFLRVCRTRIYASVQIEAQNHLNTVNAVVETQTLREPRRH